MTRLAILVGKAGPLIKLDSHGFATHHHKDIIIPVSCVQNAAPPIRRAAGVQKVTIHRTFDPFQLQVALITGDTLLSIHEQPTNGLGLNLAAEFEQQSHSSGMATSATSIMPMDGICIGPIKDLTITTGTVHPHHRTKITHGIQDQYFNYHSTARAPLTALTSTHESNTAAKIPRHFALQRVDGHKALDTRPKHSQKERN
jgi:hypothetical protein